MLSSLPVVGSFFAAEEKNVSYQANEGKSHVILTDGDKTILVTVKEVSKEVLEKKGFDLEKMHKMSESTPLKDVVNILMPKGEAEEKVEEVADEALEAVAEAANK